MGAARHNLLVSKTLSCVFKGMTFRKLGKFRDDIAPLFLQGCME